VVGQANINDSNQQVIVPAARQARWVEFRGGGVKRKFGGIWKNTRSTLTATARASPSATPKQSGAERRRTAVSNDPPSMYNGRGQARSIDLTAPTPQPILQPLTRPRARAGVMGLHSDVVKTTNRGGGGKYTPGSGTRTRSFYCFPRPPGQRISTAGGEGPTPNSRLQRPGKQRSTG